MPGSCRAAVRFFWDVLGKEGELGGVGVNRAVGVTYEKIRGLVQK